jgi:hypothetical protein
VNDSIGMTKIRGIDASVNIEIDKDAELSLVIDKGNGDYLKLKGEARLNAGIDPSGKPRSPANTNSPKVPTK